MVQAAALVVFAVAVASSAAIPDLPCTHPFPTQCTLEGVQITSSTPRYSISGYNLPTIQYLTVSSNKLAIFSPDVCAYLPQVTQIHAESVGIEQLSQDAFDNCSKLTYLSLSGNQIQVLTPHVFRGATLLQSLYLGSNKIFGVSDNQFETNIRLNILCLENNDIANFPSSAVKNSPNLSVLRLYSNNLAKLDYATLIQNSPNIYELSVNGNVFPCSTLQTVIQLYGVTSIVNYNTYINRFRLYKMSNVSGFTCVNDLITCH